MTVHEFFLVVLTQQMHPQNCSSPNRDMQPYSCEHGSIAQVIYVQKLWSRFWRSCHCHIITLLSTLSKASATICRGEPMHTVIAQHAVLPQYAEEKHNRLVSAH